MTDRRSRRTPRLQSYDYTQAGWYFITLCTHEREPLFGTIANGQVSLSRCGLIVEEDWKAIPTHFPLVRLDAFVVMPDHMHGILEITAANVTSLVTIVGGFKSGVSRRINADRHTPGATVWQRSFYDRIIRDEAELQRIQHYIAQNPSNWRLDRDEW